MRPVFAAKLLAAVGLPSPLTSGLNLDLAALPLEKYFSLRELKAVETVPGVKNRIVIATALENPTAVKKAIDDLEAGVPEKELGKLRSSLVSTWVLSNPQSLIEAAISSPDIFEKIGTPLGSNTFLNLAENLPLREALEKASTSRLRADITKEEFNGIQSYLLASHTKPDANFSALLQSPDIIDGHLILESAVGRWAKADGIATSQWLEAEADGPNYDKMVEIMVGATTDPTVKEPWEEYLKKKR